MTLIQNDCKKEDKKVERKKTSITTKAKVKEDPIIITKAKVKKDPQTIPAKTKVKKDPQTIIPKKAKKKAKPPLKRSKFVGVCWNTNRQKWHSQISSQGLGYYHVEKEAARMYDEHALLLGRPVNFPLHEGMKQAVKPKERGSNFRVLGKRPSKYGKFECAAERALDESSFLHRTHLNFHRTVGVCWNFRAQKWEVYITESKGKSKCLGFYEDEKEAARVYDEQAILLGKPVNFPLHEGMEQAVKPAPKGSKKNLPITYRASKYVGVHWKKKSRTWHAVISFNGKKKGLGCFEDEKEAASTYDDMAAVLSRPVNFPLLESQQQAVKGAPLKYKKQQKRKLEE